MKILPNKLMHRNLNAQSETGYCNALHLQPIFR